MVKFPGRRILVVAAHPDDEVLGCGGTLACAAGSGLAVHVAFLADGVGARLPHSGAVLDEVNARRAAAARAGAILGATSVEHFAFPDNRMDTVPLLDVVKIVEELIARHVPDTVLTHHAGDLNVDHRRTHEAVVTACRPQPAHCVERVMCFEVSSSTEWQPPASGAPFTPQVFVDIGKTLDVKRRALEAYGSEMRSWPHARSYEAIEHLARWRGASVGCSAAEAFMLARYVLRDS